MPSKLASYYIVRASKDCFALGGVGLRWVRMPSGRRRHLYSYLSLKKETHEGADCSDRFDHIVECRSADAESSGETLTLKSLLLEQLRTTHNKKDWFVDANTAVAGLTPEQASWKDGKGNHSAGQLAYHLVFWNQRELTKFKGDEPSKFSGNNEETFDKFDAEAVVHDCAATR